MSIRQIICGIFCFIGFFIGISNLDSSLKLSLVGVIGMIAVALAQPEKRIDDDNV